MLTRQQIIDQEDFEKEIINNENISFINVPNYKKISKLSLILEAYKIIEDTVLNSDAVIARLPSSIGLKAIQYAVKHNKPYLIEVVGCARDAYSNHSQLGKLIASNSFKKQKHAILNSKYTLYVTNEFLQGRYPTNGSSIACSDVNITVADEKILKNQLAKECNGYNFGSIGAVNMKYKGHHFVIEALKKLRDEHNLVVNYQIVGAGSSKYLDDLVEKYSLNNQVQILGALNHNEIFDWLDKIDIYIQPSLIEGLPRAIIEAMSRGLPVIGSNVGGIPELIDDEMVFDINRVPNSIVEMILELNVKRLKENIITNYNKAKEYDYALLTKKREKFYNKFKDTIIK